MIKKSVTPEEVVELLNEAVKLDPTAMDLLVNSRVSCNKELGAHPTIQVMVGLQRVVGMLGILNGIFGVNENGWGCFQIMFDDTTKKLTGFKVDYNGKNYVETKTEES